MTNIAEGARIILKNVLYLTDFSEPSAVALPFAAAIARDYGAKLHALHVLTPVIPKDFPEAVRADEDLANMEMAKIDSQLSSVNHDTMMSRGLDLWPAVEHAIQERNIDLIVLWTHGRTYAQKLLLGSFAEEIFRRSSVPVLTIGPHVRKNASTNGTFHSVLFATDFSGPCKAAAPFAVSLAEENDAHLILVYVAPKPETDEERERTVSNVMEDLNNIVPSDARRWCRPSTVIEYGDAADRILEVAAEREADLIVLGVRGASGHLGAATHLERATAHKVVAHARCPVLTVRG
jgi:nucleotide-binding universal stress UspA family protein